MVSTRGKLVGIPWVVLFVVHNIVWNYLQYGQTKKEQLMMETIYRILSACKTMTLSFSSYIPVVFIRGIPNMFFRGGGWKTLVYICMFIKRAKCTSKLDCSGKVVSTLITWNISFSPPIEFHLGNEQLIMPAPVQKN